MFGFCSRSVLSELVGRDKFCGAILLGENLVCLQYHK